MKGAIALRKPVGVPVVLDTSATNVTNAAYVVLASSAAAPASGMLVHNSGAVPLALAVGASGKEVNQIVLPVGIPTLIPIEIAKGARLTLISLGGTQSSGIISASYFA